MVVRNDDKLLQMFLNRKNANNKVNHWSLELATYNIIFEWISGVCNKAVDCLSRLVDVPENYTKASSILVNAVKASPTDRPTTHNQIKTNAPAVMPQGNTKINTHNYS